MSDTNRAVDIRNLFVEYKTYAGMVKVLNGVNFNVDAGEKVAIVGETGCGRPPQSNPFSGFSPATAGFPREKFFSGERMC